MPTFFQIALVCGLLLCTSRSQDVRSTVIQLRPNHWTFNPTQAPIATASSAQPSSELPSPQHAQSTFTLNLRANFGHSGKLAAAQDLELLTLPGIAKIVLRQDRTEDRRRQNYAGYKVPDGSVPVLEATLTLHSREHPTWTNMTIGAPLALLPQPEGEHEVVVSFTGVEWNLYVDGQLLDRDFPFGYPEWKPRNEWQIDPTRVVNSAIFFPAITPTNGTHQVPHHTTVQYWTPPGHNTWVGDVETFFYNGRYHVFYLYDRRHHQSKFGAGAHYFEHLSTTDFQTWTEHEAATPLQEQWECIGTGVPFVYNDQLCLSYGLHTTRVYPEEKTTLPLQWKYLAEHNRSGRFARDGSNSPAASVPFPIGATYSISTDGVASFRKSEVTFHPCQNPSVYRDPNGRLRMIANYGSKGFWESDSLEGGWQCVNQTFPPGGDCTIFFRWGNFDYILGGFTGLWRKPASAPDDQYQDLVRQGLDFYDGSNVPAVTEISPGRFLMAAWIPIRGWGGPLILRELEQAADGRIYSKWMPEVAPRPFNHQILAEQLTAPKRFTSLTNAFLISLNARALRPSAGTLRLLFASAPAGTNHCEFAIDLAAGRAQFAPGTLDAAAPRQKTLREGGSPQSAGNYAIENLDRTESVAVRLIVKSHPKLGGSIIDAEIGGRRTMITFRDALSVGEIVVNPEQAEVTDVHIAECRF